LTVSGVGIGWAWKLGSSGWVWLSRVGVGCPWARGLAWGALRLRGAQSGYGVPRDMRVPRLDTGCMWGAQGGCGVPRVVMGVPRVNMGCPGT